MARQEDENFKEMELWEHLAELRARLMRSLSYVGVGMVVAWVFYEPLIAFLLRPIKPLLKGPNSFVAIHVTEGFMTQLQVSMVTGLIFAVPLITLELWGFIAPGLTRTERKAFYLCVPLSLLFFFGGLAVAYVILGPAFRYFGGFLRFGDQPLTLMQNPLRYIGFVVKMELAFGLVFQLPVILMFLGYVGIVTSEMLKAHWRLALVACAVISAIATPTPDAVSMMMMAAPMGVLYLASIYLVSFVERLRERRAYRPSYDTT